MTIPLLQGAPRETEFVMSTAEEVERRERLFDAVMRAVLGLGDGVRDLDWFSVNNSMKSRTEDR